MSDSTEVKKNFIVAMHNHGLIATTGNTFYIYVTSAASWYQIYSRTGPSELLKHTGINAPINYVGPLDWVYRGCKRFALPVARIKPSICIGTMRLQYEVFYSPNKCVVKYFPHPKVIMPREEVDGCRSCTRSSCRRSSCRTPRTFRRR